MGLASVLGFVLLHNAGMGITVELTFNVAVVFIFGLGSVIMFGLAFRNT